ncbi:MAG TPA: hypothetical protein VMN57_11110 [Anaerolineales bacterium]|nr:hypothetical protein [Anaerolineales bacterium]
MDEIIRSHIDNLHATDRSLQNEAYFFLMEATGEPVDWAYKVWDGLVGDLGHADNDVRAIAAQLLANLARHSDPEHRILDDFEALLAVTRDERFVTARHALKAIWKVGAAGTAQRGAVLEGLGRRFRECEVEKNTTLIRYDIIVGLKDLCDVVGDEAVREQALEWIETEGDEKYRKKYAGVWRVKK